MKRDSFLAQQVALLRRRTGGGVTQLTGDVSAGPGSGSQTTTIANDAVTNAKLANMAADTIKGRANGAGTGDPQDLTANQVSTILDGATDPFVRTSAGASYTDEQAQDAVGTILADTATVDLTYRDIGSPPAIQADVRNASITLAKIQNAAANSKLVGSGSSGSGASYSEVTLGSGLSMSGTTLNATGGGGGGAISASGFYLDDGVTQWGPVFEMTPVVDGDYAWVNQGGASIDTTGGAVALTAPANSGNNMRIRKRSIPSAPYTRTLAFMPMSLAGANMGMVLRESGSGKLIRFCAQKNTGTLVQNFTSPTTFAGGVFTGGDWSWGLQWLRIEDDTTNHKFSFSYDGVHFLQLATQAVGAHLTADEIGFYVEEYGNIAASTMLALSWD